VSRRPILLASAVVAALGLVAIVAVVADGGDRARVTTATPAQAAGPCPAPPPGTEVAVPSGSVERDARVSVPDATEIETHGFVIGAVADGGDARTAAVITDPRAETPDGLVGTIEGTELVSVTQVVDGCTVAAIAAGADGTWAATCDPLASPEQAAGAELVLVADGSTSRRIALPTSCVGALAIGGDRAWVTNVALTSTAARLWRVDLTTGAVDEPIPLDGATVDGLAATADSLWTLRRSGDATSLVRSDAATAADVVTVPAEGERLTGITTDRVWTTSSAGGALVARDLVTGEPTDEVTVADLQQSATSPTTVWFERASRTSLTITLGRVDDAAPRTVTSFTGVGPDRSGLPFLPTLSATSRGAWLGYQNRLFLLPD
jgi:hypothetical protein